MKKLLLSIILVFSSVLTVLAQGVPTYDADKYNEIASMERGHWKFSPSWYYYFLHKNYSGAYIKWGLIPKVKFKESKSNVKSVGPRREKQLIAQAAKDTIAGLERKYIEAIYKEDVEKAADRNIDVVYSKYKQPFLDYQEKISAGLTYCLTKSKGDMSEIVKELSDRNETITSKIAYLHKTGVGYELENAKREKGYAECLKAMQQLSTDVGVSMQWAKAYYK